MELSTAAYVKDYLEKNPLLVYYLQEELINLSALTRKLLPEIQKVNKKASQESVLIAIQRNLPKKEEKTIEQINEILATLEVSLTTNISQVVFKKGNVDEKEFFDLMKKRRGDGVCIMAESRSEISLFLSDYISKEFTSILDFGEKIEKKLSVIGLHETSMNGEFNSLNIPGYLAAVFMMLAQKNISVIEVVSVYSQILLFVEEKDAIEAFRILKERNLKSQAF